MLVGIISKIISDKKIGFIKPCDSRGDVFFHCSVVVGSQFEQLQEGQPVAFDLDRAPEARERPRAIKVQPCDEKLLGRRAADEPPPSGHPRARHRKPTWRR
ncbi:MAG: cold shock domain-containing protein [Candidatus Anammoximicrobium sp.]|nr:cold shock domain-containing protein [Candidatus Anammoximicrobium sp.]